MLCGSSKPLPSMLDSSVMPGEMHMQIKRTCPQLMPVFHSQEDDDTIEGVRQWRLHDVVGAFLSMCPVSDWRLRLEEDDAKLPSKAGLPSAREVHTLARLTMPYDHSLNRIDQSSAKASYCRDQMKQGHRCLKGLLQGDVSMGNRFLAMLGHEPPADSYEKALCAVLLSYGTPAAFKTAAIKCATRYIRGDCYSEW